MKNLILFCLLLSPCLLNAQNEKWDYPVKPGTEEWKKLESNKAKVDICQIPKYLLNTIPTSDLMDICLQYPLIWDMYAFNNLNEGLEKLFNDFNGIRELFKRTDVSKELLTRYVKNLSILEGKKDGSLNGELIISISTLEVLLSCPALQNNISKDVQKNILKYLTLGFERKYTMPSDFQGFGFRMNFFSRAHVIQKMDNKHLNKLPQESANAVMTSVMVDEQSFNAINDLSYQLLR